MTICSIKKIGKLFHTNLFSEWIIEMDHHECVWKARFNKIVIDFTVLKTMEKFYFFTVSLLLFSVFAFRRQQSCLPKALKALFDDSSLFNII
jgi:hypothetical protein